MGEQNDHYCSPSHRGRLARGTSLGMVLCGLPFSAIVIWESPAEALVLLVAVGGGYALTEVGLLTLT